jgi:hypothetical protein
MLKFLKNVGQLSVNFMVLYSRISGKMLSMSSALNISSKCLGVISGAGVIIYVMYMDSSVHIHIISFFPPHFC